MLAALIIRNVVLIEMLDIRFQGGFCALTGETGAGKSILLDSLGLALGGRSDSGLVRKGADQASVTAEFHLDEKHPLHDLLKEQGLDSDTTLILRRVLGTDGRSRAFINDQPVSIGLLKQCGDTLVEIHSQFETHGLLDARTHRGLLDDYAGLGVDVRGLQTTWTTWRDAVRECEACEAEAEKARADEDYLRHAVKELEALDPQPGEEETLLIQRESMKHRDQTVQSLDETWQAISGDAGAEMMVGRAMRTLERLGDRAGQDMGQAIDALTRAGDELQAAITIVQSAMTAMESGGLNLEQIEDRLYALRGVARKHHVQVDDLSRVLADYIARLDTITGHDDRIATLRRAVQDGRAAYVAAASAISKKRAAAAGKLDKAVAIELPPLKLDKARFMTAVDTSADESGWGPDGMDRVQFLVSTNPGADPGPLGKIASGGEMSRFMLSIKVVMAATGAAPSLVFDEVDSGIGGSTADAVGERLARLSQSKQILVVTHAPQVAARADHHYIVMKQGDDRDVRTTVIALKDRTARQEEIARMLSGASITVEARAAAQKLMDAG